MLHPLRVESFFLSLAVDIADGGGSFRTDLRVRLLGKYRITVQSSSVFTLSAVPLHDAFFSHCLFPPSLSPFGKTAVRRDAAMPSTRALAGKSCAMLAGVRDDFASRKDSCGGRI